MEQEEHPLPASYLCSNRQALSCGMETPLCALPCAVLAAPVESPPVSSRTCAAVSEPLRYRPSGWDNSLLSGAIPCIVGCYQQLWPLPTRSFSSHPQPVVSATDVSRHWDLPPYLDLWTRCRVRNPSQTHSPWLLFLKLILNAPKQSAQKAPELHRWEGSALFARYFSYDGTGDTCHK